MTNPYRASAVGLTSPSQPDSIEAGLRIALGIEFAWALLRLVAALGHPPDAEGLIAVAVAVAVARWSTFIV